MSQPVITMDTPFKRTNNNENSKEILKIWVKESSKFRMTPNQVYKIRILQKAYQFFVIFACCLYAQESTKTFLQS